MLGLSVLAALAGPDLSPFAKASPPAIHRLTMLRSLFGLCVCVVAVGCSSRKEVFTHLIAQGVGQPETRRYRDLDLSVCRKTKASRSVKG